MKTIIRWFNNRVTLWMLLSAGVATDLILVGRAYDLSKSDWGTWVGAVGTVAALCGTIYIAQTETRRRERGEHDLALITAASFSVRIPEMWQALIELERHVTSDRGNFNAIDCNQCIAILARVDTWTQSDLVALLPLGPGIAVRLGLAQAEVASIMGRLKEGDRGAPVISNPQLSSALRRALCGRIDVVMKHLAGTREACLAFLLQAGFDDAFAVSQRASIKRSQRA